jgi:hypothetical protein
MIRTESTFVNEPIEVSDTRFNYFPKTFLWRGRAHHVRSVDRCWTVSRRRVLNTVKRHCFRVRTADAIYDLHQDPARDAWYLDRVIAWEGSEP